MSKSKFTKDMNDFQRYFSGLSGRNVQLGGYIKYLVDTGRNAVWTLMLPCKDDGRIMVSVYSDAIDRRLVRAEVILKNEVTEEHPEKLYRASLCYGDQASMTNKQMVKCLHTLAKKSIADIRLLILNNEGKHKTIHVK